MTDRVKYKNPFAMGNLDDLFNARMYDDVEYLKEWSRMAVKYHEESYAILFKSFEYLCGVRKQSHDDVEKIRIRLRELYDNGVEV